MFDHAWKMDSEYKRKTYEETEEELPKIKINANHKMLNFMTLALWLFIMMIAVPDAVYMIGRNTVLRSLSNSSVWYIMTVLFFVCIATIYYSYSKRMSNAFSTRFFGKRTSEKNL